MEKRNNLKAFVKTENSVIVYFTDDEGNHWLQDGNSHIAGQPKNKNEALKLMEKYKNMQLEKERSDSKVFIA